MDVNGCVHNSVQRHLPRAYTTLEGNWSCQWKESKNKNCTRGSSLQAQHQQTRFFSRSVSTGPSDNGERLIIDLGEKERITLDLLLVRDSCSCPQCIDPSTSQKLFQTADIPASITGHVEQTSDPSTITIAWANDIPGFPSTHRTQLSKSTLRTSSPSISPSRDHILAAQAVPPPGRKPWDRGIMQGAVRWLDFARYMSDDGELFTALEQLRVYGLVFLRGVPDAETAVEDVAGRIGTLRDSFYGRTWDVRSVPDAKNIAYTHQFLGLHMDLL